MYNCHLNIYLAGNPCRTFEIIKEMSPLEHFTHSFFETAALEESMASDADVIVADMTDMDMKEALQILASDTNIDTQIILLADKSQMAILTENPSATNVQDIWINPMSNEEVQFRFLRWQQTYKMSKDFWQTNQYLESTINNIPNLIWYKDKNGLHEKVNDSFCKTVNKSKQQVEGRGHAYIWDVEQDDPACIESERKVMEHKKTYVSEETIMTGDGTRQLTTYKSPLYNLDGSVMGTVGVGIDVTQERAYEQEIIKKKQTLETIFTTIDCGVICHTLDGSQIISINRAALKILGYNTQEELSNDGFDVVAASVLDEDKEKLRACIRELKDEGDSVSVEYRVQHKNGEILHVMGNIKLYKENGELFYQRFLLDCTEQKLQEKRNERRQMELIQALSTDFTLVCFVDPNTSKVTPIRNEVQGAGDIFNGDLLLEECMAQYIQRSVYEDDKEMLRQAMSLDTLKTELIKKNLYYVNYRKSVDDEIVYFQIKAVGVGTVDGDLGIVLGFRSVDDEIRREMEHSSLLEAALSQAKKASNAKTIFLSNMSHDIRTPMNAIVGFTNLAISRIDQKDQVEEYLKKIMASGNHLLNLINDILDMSHIESGKVHLDENIYNLPEILHGLRSIIQADIQAKQHDLQIDIIDVVDENIYCDKLRLNQVLLNLLSNAVKYTPAGGSIRIQLTEKPGAPTGYAAYEFHIKDNGIGMSREFVEHIFEPFEREKNSTISGIQGTGLGMAITKNIVDLMGGSIEVQSEQGSGSEFTVSFTFRLYHDTKDTPEMSDSKANPHSSTHSDYKCNDSADSESNTPHTGRILLVEDVELNQEIAVALLEDAGFITEVAQDGSVAVDMVKQSEPGYYQMILMDVQMPVMNGYEATQKIRNLENRSLASIPIIAMTANAFEEDKQTALKCGMNGHIAKPIDIQMLFETMNSVL